MQSRSYTHTYTNDTSFSLPTSKRLSLASLDPSSLRYRIKDLSERMTGDFIVTLNLMWGCVLSKTTNTCIVVLIVFGFTLLFHNIENSFITTDFFIYLYIARTGHSLTDSLTDLLTDSLADINTLWGTSRYLTPFNLLLEWQLLISILQNKCQNLTNLFLFKISGYC